jgi:hypothetical protein
MLEKNEQSDITRIPIEKSESCCYCSALPKGVRLMPTLLYAMAGRPPRPPVIREKSQFRAQNDSLSLSPAH